MAGSSNPLRLLGFVPAETEWGKRFHRAASWWGCATDESNRDAPDSRALVPHRRPRPAQVPVPGGAPPVPRGGRERPGRGPHVLPRAGVERLPPVGGLGADPGGRARGGGLPERAQPEEARPRAGA